MSILAVGESGEAFSSTALGSVGWPFAYTDIALAVFARITGWRPVQCIDNVIDVIAGALSGYCGASALG